jgi:hypothetical protein
MSDSAATAHSLVVSDAWYQQLDEGIRFAVRVLHARGIQTGQSCQGGPGHSYEDPTVDVSGGGRFDGWAALAALEEYGLRVSNVSLVWTVRDGLVDDTFWRLTLRRAWPERADEAPIFAWNYHATETDGRMPEWPKGAAC